eukprot:10197401-Lingulodinium_polyedra.AAC.1
MLRPGMFLRSSDLAGRCHGCESSHHAQGAPYVAEAASGEQVPKARLQGREGPAPPELPWPKTTAAQKA